jgi:hypothetical protein
MTQTHIRAHSLTEHMQKAGMTSSSHRTRPRSQATGPPAPRCRRKIINHNITVAQTRPICTSTSKKTMDAFDARMRGACMHACFQNPDYFACCCCTRSFHVQLLRLASAHDAQPRSSVAHGPRRFPRRIGVRKQEHILQRINKTSTHAESIASSASSRTLHTPLGSQWTTSRSALSSTLLLTTYRSLTFRAVRRPVQFCFREPGHEGTFCS